MGVQVAVPNQSLRLAGIERRYRESERGGLEIKQVARKDAVTAADGAVSLFERLWPALEHIDTSSGAVGSAVYWTQAELMPVIIEAPADRKTRDKWLERLWQAVEEDGVNYLDPVEEHWGELCGSREVASAWADRFVPLVRQVWSDTKSHGYVCGATLCYSSLLAAGRHQDIWDLLKLARYPSWHDRKFGVEALVREGRTEDAIAYAEASRGLNQPDPLIDAACERILLDAGRAEEAYARYALTANQAATGLATYRAILKKYPDQDRAHILTDLAERTGDPGRFFAAAKEAGFHDLALRFAREGRTDPRTLTRAARDFATKKPEFAMAVGRLALERLLQGHGYELTDVDIAEAYRHFVAAAATRGLKESAIEDAVSLANAHQRNPLAEALLQEISGGGGAARRPAPATRSYRLK